MQILVLSDQSISRMLRIYIKSDERTKETATSVQLEIKIRNSNFICPGLIKSVLILMEYALNRTVKNDRIIRHVYGGGRKKVGI